ncbi:MAG: hypothetical protein K1X92_07790 [Bacteroidia bacterium]|nr:hypothetical protein [Bacteroidia bacterium]
MKKFLLISLSIAYLWILNSCITIEENYTFKKNGSGTMEYKMDMSKMMEQMGQMMDMSQMEGGNPLGKSASFTEVQDKLKGISGISGVKVTDDSKKYIYGVSFKFKSLDALNEAMNLIMMNKAKGDPEYFTFVKKEGNRYYYQNSQSSGAMQDISGMFGGEMDSEYAMSSLESFKYNVTMNFPSEVNAIYSGLNGDESVSSEGKVLKITTNLKEMTEKGESGMSTAVICNK